MTEFLTDGPKSARATILLGHGGGMPMDADWMTSMAAAFASQGFRVVRFEYTYMTARRTGPKVPRSDRDELKAEFRSAVDQVYDGVPLIVGGKSTSATVASLIGDDLYAARTIVGVLGLGFPFHRSGEPTTLIAPHLAQMKAPTLIVQGAHDVYGAQQHTSSYPVSANVELSWLPGADHDFAPLPGSSQTRQQNIAIAAEQAAFWANRILPD